MSNMSTLGKNTLGEKFGPYNSSGLLQGGCFKKKQKNSSINVFKQNENLNA